MSERTKSVKRIEYIDIAKGIGILLVVFGHVVRGENYDMPYASAISNSIYTFHMPLFFVISGLCIKESKMLDKQTVKKMVNSYLIPYLFWTVIYILLFQTIGFVRAEESIFSFDNNLFDHAISLCGVAPLWFLLALFFAEFFTIWIKPVLAKKAGYYLTLLLLGLLTVSISFLYDSLTDISLVLHNYIVGFFRIFPTTFFVVLGYGSKDKFKQLTESKLCKRIILLIVLISLQAVMCFFWNESIDVHVFRLGIQWLYFPKAIIVHR